VSSGRVFDRRLIVLLLLVGLVALGISIPRTADQSPTSDLGGRIPERVDAWVGSPGAPEEILPIDERAVETVRRTYTDGSSTVWLALARYRPRGEAEWRPSIDRIAFARGATTVSKARVDLTTDGGRPTTLGTVRVSRGARHVLMIFWYEVGPEVMAGEYHLRFRLFVDTLRRRRPTVVVVRMATTGPQLPQQFVRGITASLIDTRS
jgi:hypothetical protein